MGLADLHIHSIYSYDGIASIPTLLVCAKQVGLDVIAITDHDEIAGALKALELAPSYSVEVMPAIELQLPKATCLRSTSHRKSSAICRALKLSCELVKQVASVLPVILRRADWG